MTTEPSELLDRISTTLRHEVGPAVGDEYNRTQTFMASVILGKLAKQLALGPAHGEAERADVEQLHQQLAATLATAPAEVTIAAEQAAAAGTVAALSPLVEAVYRWGPEQQEAEAALALIRQSLRRDIDRRMEIAT
ncbi:MAG: hypothetical protein ACR2QK_17925 [Acidimicrobiales bacterium]